MAKAAFGAMALPEAVTPSVVTLGTFDGVHVGHQLLIDTAVREARARGVQSVVYTFEPHPAKVLAPAMAPRTLMSVEERIRCLAERGVDLVVVEPFDRRFSEVSAEDWVEQYLVARLHPALVVVGFNFGYGRDRRGNPAHLLSEGQRFGFSVEVLGAVETHGVVASSTRIRELLLEGNVDGATLLLGRPFAITGRVVPGDRRGRELGFPTANVEPDAELVPAHGVYATRFGAEDGERSLPSVTNIGRRPTFAGDRVTIETHVLDYSRELYGSKVRVELVQRIRDERRFHGIEDLKVQLQKDVEAARRILAG